MRERANPDTFKARATFDTGSGQAYYYRLAALEEAGIGEIAKMPYSVRVLLETLLRNEDGYVVSADDIRRLAAYHAGSAADQEIAFILARVVLQEFTGVPAVGDLAALRSAMHRDGGDPKQINPNAL